MKLTLLSRNVLLATILAFAGAGTVLAQDAPPSPAPDSGPGGGHHHMDKVLTPDEQAELKKDTDAVFAANPDLKKEHDDLMAQRPGPDATADDKMAFHQKMHETMGKIRDAVEKIDPNAAPLFAKLEAAHKAAKKADAGQ
jgi:hypothetical protein